MLKRLATFVIFTLSLTLEARACSYACNPVLVGSRVDGYIKFDGVVLSGEKVAIVRGGKCSLKTLGTVDSTVAEEVGRSHFSVVTDEAGRFHFEEIPPGYYVFRITTPDGTREHYIKVVKNRPETRTFLIAVASKLNPKDMCDLGIDWNFRTYEEADFNE